MQTYRAFFDGTPYGPLAQICATVMPEFLELMEGRTWRISSMLPFSPTLVLVQWFEYDPDGTAHAHSEFFVPP